ncbi:hypothetical protein SISSUDRAFT_1045694, partial [Sistotremastrum suecicum HHB10207 ss-3]
MSAIDKVINQPTAPVPFQQAQAPQTAFFPQMAARQGPYPPQYNMGYPPPAQFGIPGPSNQYQGSAYQGSGHPNGQWQMGIQNGAAQGGAGGAGGGWQP